MVCFVGGFEGLLWVYIHREGEKSRRKVVLFG